MKKEMTLAEMLNKLEERANEIKKQGTFKGNNKDFASVLLAGLEMLAR